MATTYVAPKAAPGVQPHDFKPGANTITSTFDIAAAVDAVAGGGAGGAAFVINDVVQMMKIPKGARVTEAILTAVDLDTNVAPAITLDVGDGVDPDRFIAASVIGQTGGTVRLGQGIVTNTPAFTYTADDTIDVLVKAAPATAVAVGTITLSVTFTTDL